MQEVLVNEGVSLSDLVENADALAERCLETDSADDCDSLDQVIHDIDALARETIQDKLTDQLLHIAAKLETGARPTPEEERLIEIVVIGAASRYVDMENNVPEWKAELRRLLSEIDTFARDDANVDALLRVRALCRDAAGVLPDLRHWMIERERIGRFRAAAASADPKRSTTLASYIRGVLRADNR
jgi:hypothetical protein